MLSPTNHHKRLCCYLLLLCSLMFTGCAESAASIAQGVVRQSTIPWSAPAFPGAEGYGANAIGGRGGRVIEVTTLDDSGPGSLRAAIEAQGPRIVVFRVAGTIELLTPLIIKNPYITIAGQSAPGGGIALKSHNMDDAPLEISTQHVVVRYLRVRPGPMSTLSHNVDALIIAREARHIMIDHCSFSWATDENISIWYNARNITIQWSIISEALLNSTHDAGPQSYGLLIGDQTTDISIHHNLMAHNHRRNPRATGGNIDIINNLIYNAGATPSRLFGDAVEGNPMGGYYNYIGNFIKPGPSSEFDFEVKLDVLNGGVLSAFLAQNIAPHRPDNTQAEQSIVHPDGRRFMANVRWPGPFTTITPAQTAYDQVLADAGATLPVRDDADRRLVDEVRSGGGRIIDDPQDVGGWPTLSPGVAAADSDHDGMPDEWETANGLLPTDATDGPIDSDGDGYSNVEEFLNSTDPHSAPPTSLHIGAINGFAVAQNVAHNWQARAAVLVENESHLPLPNAKVTGIWGMNESDADTCITDKNGLCYVNKNQLVFQPQRSDGFVIFLITDVIHDAAAYAPALNHQLVVDPEIPQPGLVIYQPVRLFLPHLPITAP